ncbi:Ppx/GppA phosphatase family protein [Pleomorphomonas oryzae]|uniref:Ppx/GppA phosphatase family protein n=1 Tax=Pleomorphomonas oryzae TaxID=261934 RepID=UPI001AEC1716|nr:Ppx/GppA phosphatase family protein [Pleomorphomonas oryzae]
MGDAGDQSDRADTTRGRADPTANAAADGASDALSKRAARRRRKRRSGSGAAADRTSVGHAPTTGDKQPERATNPPPVRSDSPAVAKSDKTEAPAGKPREEGPRRRRRRGPAKGALRGVRKPGREDGRPEEGRGREGERRKSGDRHAEGGEARSSAGAAAHHHHGHAPHGREGSRRGMVTGPLYAALDLGTNNCRLLVAEPQDRGFRVIDAYSRIVRLGEGIGRTGRLSDAAMDRAVEALAVCRGKLADLKVRRMRLIATEACRQAENGALFLDRVRRETGLSLEIVSRETEARLAVAGCATLIDPRSEGVLLFDIGGGSSELVWLDLRHRGEARGFALTRFIKSWTSLPVGVVTLSERHGGHMVTPDIYRDMVDEVSGLLEGFEGMEGAADLVASGGAHMLGTSGTVTTLAGIHLGLKRYDRRRVDGVWLDGGEVDKMIHRLIDMGYDQRVANPCIGLDRADLVLAGCAILEAIRRKWPCQRLRVADRGLREGILVELMARDGVWRRRPQPARTEVHV